MAILGSFLLALLVASDSANAARMPITGTLSRPNYTVIALAPGGKAAVVRARSGRFKIRPPAGSVTLQLRAPDGRYAGPVVVAVADKRAILGVRAGARLGPIRVRRGHARAETPLSESARNDGLVARAKRGVPIGARKFGRVRSRGVKRPGPGDLDIDGIPDVLDVDDDGDRMLDKVDPLPARTGRAAQAEERFDFHSRLTLYLNDTVNANAAALETEQVDAAVARSLDLLVTVLPGDPVPSSPELDCGGSIQQPPRPHGLIYCRPEASGGIGRRGPGPDGPPFPDCCDDDGDGLGTLVADTGPSGIPLTGMTLHPGATTQRIATGDVMLQRVIRDGAEVAFLGSLQYLIATVPTLVSFDDGVYGTRTITYPYTQRAGLRGEGFPVTGQPNSDTILTLKFWRPQRRAVAAWGESGDWIDIGGLHYHVQVEESGLRCPQSTFSENHPDLVAQPSAIGSPGIQDIAPDRAANPNNTITYTLNLQRCLEENGFPFSSGYHRAASFLATNPNGPDNAQQTVWFKRE